MCVGPSTSTLGQSAPLLNAVKLSDEVAASTIALTEALSAKPVITSLTLTLGLEGEVAKAAKAGPLGTRGGGSSLADCWAEAKTAAALDPEPAGADLGERRGSVGDNDDVDDDHVGPLFTQDSRSSLFSMGALRQLRPGLRRPSAALRRAARRVAFRLGGLGGARRRVHAEGEGEAFGAVLPSSAEEAEGSATAGGRSPSARSEASFGAQSWATFGGVLDGEALLLETVHCFTSSGSGGRPAFRSCGSGLEDGDCGDLAGEAVGP